MNTYHFAINRMAVVLAIVFACLISCPLSAQAQAPAPQKARLWKAATGGFEVKAVLIEHSTTFVKLRKADGRVVTVPLAKLSQADRDFVADLNKDKDPFAGGVPASDGGAPSVVPKQPTAPMAPTQVEMVDKEPAEALPDDAAPIVLGNVVCPPLPADPTVSQWQASSNGSVSICPMDAYDKPSPLMLVDSKTGVVAISLSRNIINRADETRGRVFLGKLPQGPFHPILDMKQTVQLLDHSPQTGQTLVVVGTDHFQRGGEIQLWEGLESGKPKAIARGQMPGAGKPGFAPKAEAAWLLAKNVAVVQVNNALFCWDLLQRKLIYKTDRNTVNTLRQPTLSGGRKYLLLPGAAGGCNVVEAATGKDLGRIDAQSHASSGFVFHADGRRIAITSSNLWSVYDLTAGKLVKSGVVAAHLHNKLLGWVGDHSFMTESGMVVDADEELVVWSYYASPSASKRLWDGALSVVGTIRSLQIHTAIVPEPRAVRAVAALPSQKGLMVTQRGTEVRIVVATEDAEVDELKAALEVAIKRAGWKVNDNAKLAVIATIGRGKPYEMKFRDIRAPFGGKVDVVKINPFTAKLEIRDANGVLWKRNTENHIPHMLMLKAGETVQAAVKRYEQPQPSFFSGLQIPTRIPKPQIARGLGRSRLDQATWVDFPFRD